MLSINTNLSSLIAQRSMKQSTNKLNQAIERMTTGFKINHAKDNAANYNIATNMTTQIGSYEVAEDNTMTSLDLLTTASDSLALIQDRIQRLRDLQEQAMNGTYGEQSLRAINEECCALVDEINRVYETTEFNGISLFLEPTEMPDGTVAVVKETDAKLDTTFKELGITATAFEIYDSDNNLIQAYDLEEEDTIQDFFDTLQTHGFSTELRNGVMNIQSTNLSYIDGDLATALGIQTKEIIDVSYTTETETIWTTTTSETTKTNTIFSTTTSTTTQTSTIYSTTTIENISTIPIEITTTNYVLTTNTLTVPATIDEVAPLAESGGGFIQEVVRRDTSTMTALSSVDPNSELVEGTYSISTTDELLKLAEIFNSDMYESPNDTFQYSEFEFILADNIDLSTIENWTPVTLNKNTEITFDGKGYTITNLKSNIGGLFSTSNSKGWWIVSNLGIENADIQTENDNVGIIINNNTTNVHGSDISNCYTTGIISGGNNIGGLTNLGVVAYSYSTAEIYGNNYVGGLVGKDGVSAYSYFAGAVTGNDYIGGLVGEGYGVYNSTSAGIVSGRNYVGGLAGVVQEIGDSHFTGTVIGENTVGGLAGYMENSDQLGFEDEYAYTSPEIYQSSCSGNVTGVSNVGGLTGFGCFLNIYDSYFDGIITGENAIGGLVGTHDSDITPVHPDIEPSVLIENSSVLTSSTDLDGIFVGNLINDTNGVISPLEIVNCSYNSVYDELGTPIYRGDTPVINNVTPIGVSPPTSTTTVTLNTTFAELGLSDSFQVKSGSGSLLVNVTGTMTLESFINSINSISGYNAELLNGVLLINSLEEVIGLESLNPQKSSNTSTISTTSIQTTTTEQVTTTTITQTITTTSTSSVVDTQTLLVTTTSSTTNTTTLWTTSTVATTQTMDKQTYKAIMENVYAPGEIGFLVGTNASPEQNISVNIAFKLDDISGFKGIGVDNYDYLSQIDSLLKKLSEKQVYYGAMQNRMMSVLEEISVKKENLVSSRSTLRDADISEVSSSYIQQQILQQASATLLATANQSPSIALQLI